MKSVLRILLLAFCAVSVNAQDLSKMKVISNGKTEVLANTAVVRFKTFKDNSLVKISLLKTAKAQVAKQILKPEESFTFNKNLSKKQGNSILSAQKVTEITRAEEPLLKTVVVTYEGAETPQEFCKRIMRENPDVERAEPYFVERPLGTPNDPFKSQQKYLNTIRAQAAWDLFDGDTSMVIAISDNAIVQTHEDLKASIARNWGEIPNNNIDDDNNGYVDDFEGYTFEPNTPKGNTSPGLGSNAAHGTNVAGIAGGTWNNGVGISGVGAKCRIFPLKIAPKSDNSRILWGYDAIMYAAQNNFKVINCSWGSPGSYSFANQEIIDYAVARGVAVVAAAGNLSNKSVYYPAGYRGVLGVGETQQDDLISNVSNFGSHVDIMAPGDHAYTTGIYDNYEDSFGGTSFASPMVAAMVALIRAKHPQLTALQAIEFARHSVDDVSGANPFNTKLIPGRMNLEKAMIDEPFGLPGIRPIELHKFRTNLTKVERLVSGDTAFLKIKARNELGAGKNVKFTLSVLEDFENVIEVITPEVTIADVLPTSEIMIDAFKIRIKNTSRTSVFLRVDMADDNGYTDYFLLPFIPTSEITTFKNAVASYSVSDRGRIGFGNTNGDDKEGVGFVYSEFGSVLYKGGLIVAQSPDKVLSAVENEDFSNPFTVVKPFAAPDTSTGIISDASAGAKKIGLEITQYFTLLKDSNGVAYAKISLKNTSGAVLHDVAAGYYFDWDVSPNSSANKGRLFPEAIPQNALKTAAACIVESSLNYPVAGCAVSTSQPGAEAQIAVYDVDSEPGESFEDATKYQSLTSGTSQIFSGASDIFVVAGMKFGGAWQPGETKSFILLFGAAISTSELQARFKTMLDSTFSSIKTDLADGEFLKMYPQPAGNFITIEGNIGSGNAQISVISVDGKIVIPAQNIMLSGDVFKTPISTENLASGKYFVRIETAGKILLHPLVIQR
jgi:subtilisin family serine protease